jgi:hypothetical protein
LGTIRASIDVNVNPAVISAGGTQLATIGLLLDNSTAVPIAPLGSTLSFPDVAAVEDYFGAGSLQASLAAKYFNGFTNRKAIPSALLVAQYPSAPVAGWLRGGALTQTLAQLQALTGSLTVTMDGYAHVISSISLSANASFSAIAAALTAGFTNPTEASFTASMGASFTASGSGTALTVTAVTGYISPGDVITGTGVPGGTTIVSQNSGGTPGGAGTYVTSGATTTSSASCTTTSSVLDVTVCASPTIAVGQTVVGGSVQVGTLITSQISGTAGGVGLYATNVAGVPTKQTSASASLTAAATAPVVTYSSLYSAFVVTSGITGAASSAAFATGTLASPLGLTQANGATVSAGAATTTPGAFMAAVVAKNQNWVSFTTDFDPDAAFFTATISGTAMTVDSLVSGAILLGDLVTGPGVAANTYVTGGSALSWTVSVSQTVSVPVNMSSWAPGGGHGNTQKLAFAAWNNSVPNRYLYAMWDTDITPTLTASATGSAGYIVTTGIQYEGTVPIYMPTDLGHHAFLMGAIASINFEQTDGRLNLKFKTQGGITPAVTDETVATNLGSGATTGANGYNFIAVIATAADQFIYWRNGQISGSFGWIDSFIDAIWLNQQMQLALLALLTNVNSIPYNPAGYSMIAVALTGGATAPVVLPPQSPVAKALNFGAIRINVPLSAGQAAAVNADAGLTIDGILSTRGWYLQVLPATPEVRAARGSPPTNLWYTDGQSINNISLTSTEIQ